MYHEATPRSDVDDKPMTHRRPSDQNEAVRQWSRQTDTVERAMTYEAKYVDAFSFKG